MSDTLISEAEVLKRRPLLASSLLRAARKASRITWTKGKRNTAWYRLSDVDAFIAQEREQPGRREGGACSTADPPPIPKELKEHVARAAAQRILGSKRRKAGER